MKKGFLFVLLTAVFLVFLPRANALAAPDFAVNYNENARRGDVISVPVTVRANTGFAAVGLNVSYDSSVLELTGVSQSTDSMQLNRFLMTASPGSQPISFISANLQDWTGSGTIAVLTFSVKAGAPLGNSPITLSFTQNPDGAPANSGGGVLSAALCFSGSVNVVSQNAAPPPAAAENPSSNDDELWGNDDIFAYSGYDDEDISMPDGDSAWISTANDSSDSFGAVPRTKTIDTGATAAAAAALGVTAAALALALKKRKRA